jgi:hypothetical protein
MSNQDVLVCSYMAILVILRTDRAGKVRISQFLRVGLKLALFILGIVIMILIPLDSLMSFVLMVIVSVATIIILFDLLRGRRMQIVGEK